MKKLKRIFKRIFGMEIRLRDYSPRELYVKGYVVCGMEREVEIHCK